MSSSVSAINVWGLLPLAQSLLYASPVALLHIAEAAELSFITHSPGSGFWCSSRHPGLKTSSSLWSIRSSDSDFNTLQVSLELTCSCSTQQLQVAFRKLDLEAEWLEDVRGKRTVSLLNMIQFRPNQWSYPLGTETSDMVEQGESDRVTLMLLHSGEAVTCFKDTLVSPQQDKLALSSQHM